MQGDGEVAQLANNGVVIDAAGLYLNGPVTVLRPLRTATAAQRAWSTVLRC